MILRRLTENIKSQNWSAVVLDFVIVVLGILIAFQITNWSTEREEKRVYDEAFERLVTELERNLAMQKAVRRDIAIELPIIQTALEDLRACRTGEDAIANVNAAMVPLNAPYMMLLETSAMEQFLNNDAFLRYQSTDARQLLLEILRVSELMLWEDRLRQERTARTIADLPDSLSLGPLAVTGPDEILEVVLSDSPLSPPLYREPVITVPLDEACQDKAFVGLFYDWEANAFDISIRAGVMKPELRKALELLGRPVSEEGEAS